ncbi:hypothetical protein [Streptomyces sp. NPDC048191]|uniref:hypothetical protein n=1 Tax=Streptomyces sp. NPDC048191 TaxID=3155484 RepID=UPI0033C4770E
MELLKADDVVLGGYVLALPVVREPWQDSNLVPARFVTISRCFLADGTPHPEFYDWYIDRAEAEHARIRFAPAAELLAVGLSQEDAQLLKRDHASSTTWAESEERESTEPSALTLLSAGQSLPPDARILGFDVVGVEYGVSFSHSWLCYSYEAEVWGELRIRPNAEGLLPSYESAVEVLAWMDSRPAEKAPEPVPWTVVIIARCQPEH